MFEKINKFRICKNRISSHNKINDYWNLALKDPFPNENALLDNVFGSK